MYNEFIFVLDDGVTRVFINTDGDRYGISKDLVNLIDYIYYSYWNNTEDNVYNNGEVRFTWSDDIAGFISEKITYNKN